MRPRPKFGLLNRLWERLAFALTIAMLLVLMVAAPAVCGERDDVLDDLARSVLAGADAVSADLDGDLRVNASPDIALGDTDGDQDDDDYSAWIWADGLQLVHGSTSHAAAVPYDAPRYVIDTYLATTFIRPPPKFL